MKTFHYKEHLLLSFKGLWSWSETIILTLLILLISYLLNHNDPLSLNSTFPWVWFAPVIIALRYGTLRGAASIVIIVLTAIYYAKGSIVQSLHYRYYMLGGVLITVLCGEFHSSWQSTMSRFQQTNRYIRKRLDSLNRAFYLVRLSHDRLEQSLIGKPITLRTVLRNLQLLLSHQEGRLDNNIANQLIHLIDQYCALEKAGLYLVKDDNINTDPIAHIGKEFPKLNPDDIMVKQCLEHNASYYAVNQLTEKQQSQYIAVISMRTLSNKLLGILAIETIPFWSLNEKALQTIGIILSYFADDYFSTQISKDVLAAYPDCPPHFAADLGRLIRLKKEFNAKSTLAAFVISRSARWETVSSEIKHRFRALDLYWEHKEKDRSVLFVLMPFSNTTSSEGFKKQFKEFLKEEFDITLQQKEVYLRYLEILETDSIANIKQLMEYINRQ